MSITDRDIIVTCAVTPLISGGPLTARSDRRLESSIEEADECVDAGASVVLFQVRDPLTNRVVLDMDRLRIAAASIRRFNHASIDIAIGDVSAISDDEMAGLIEISPDAVTVEMPLAADPTAMLPQENRKRQARQATASPDMSSAVPDALRRLDDMGVPCRVICRDLAQISTFESLIVRGLKASLVMAGNSIADPNPRHLPAMMEYARDLFLDQMLFSAAAPPQLQRIMAAHALVLGGHLHVGVGLATRSRQWNSPNSVEQVKRVVSVVDALGLEVATPRAARWLL